MCCGQACNCLIFQFFHYRVIIIIIITIIITRSSCPSQVVCQLTTNKTFLRHNCITFSRCYYMCTETSYLRCGLISRTRYLDVMNTDDSATSFYYVLMRSSCQLRYSNKGVPLYSHSKWSGCMWKMELSCYILWGRIQEDKRSFKTTLCTPCASIAESDAFVHCQSQRFFKIILKLRVVYQLPRNRSHAQEHEVSSDLWIVSSFGE